MGKKNNKKAEEKPEVYSLSKKKQGWELNRRRFIAGAAAAGAALAGTKLNASGKRQEQAFKPGASPDAYTCAEVFAHTDRINCLVFSPDGKILASGSEDNKIKLWDVAKQGLLKVFSEHTNYVNALDITPNSRWLISGSEDKTIKVWDLKKQELHISIDDYSDEVNGVAVYNNLRAITGYENGKVRLWKIKTGQEIQSWDAQNYIYGMAYCPQNKILATGHYKKIKLWSLKKGNIGKLLKEITTKEYGYSLAFTPNGKWLVSGSTYYDNLYIWEIPKGTLKNTGAVPYLKRVYAVAVRPNNKYIASGGKTDHVRIFNLPMGKLKKTFGDDDGYVTALAFSPNGKILAAGEYEGELKLYKLPNGKQLGCLMDVNANTTSKNGIKYKYLDPKGNWIEITIPVCSCAPPMPTGAVCVCNTVPGTCTCVGYTCSCVGYTCSCQGYCSVHFHYWYPN